MVTISQSRGLKDLIHPLTQQVPRRLIIDDKQKDPILHLPTSDIDTHLLQVFRRWDNRLSTFGLEISTGPVVPFRATDMLTSNENVRQGKAVPLLWLQHIRRITAAVWSEGLFSTELSATFELRMATLRSMLLN